MNYTVRTDSSREVENVQRSQLCNILPKIFPNIASGTLLLPPAVASLHTPCRGTARAVMVEDLLEVLCALPCHSMD